MEEQKYKIKLEKFEGPLDLLLTLIEKRKMSINEISLAKIADDYIAYIRNLSQFPLADGAHFVLIASTLVLIKSRSLLPNLAITEEEQASIEDLEERLKIYKQMRDLSANIKEKFGKEMIFDQQARRIDPVFSPTKEITITNLFQSVREAIKNLPKKEILPKAVVRKVLSLEDMMKNLSERIKSSLKISFRDFAGKFGKEEKVNVIVGFLAMLELVKQGVINVTQHRDFEDITIETNRINTPQYTN